MEEVGTAGTAPPFEGVVERSEGGLVVLSPASGHPSRRVLFVNSYGGRTIWRKIKEGVLPGHHLWGAPELARMGYEVILAEPLKHFYLHRNPFPHDLALLRFCKRLAGQGRDRLLCPYPSVLAPATQVDGRI